MRAFCMREDRMAERETDSHHEERNSMEQNEKPIIERLEAATTLLERTLTWLEERQGTLAGEVERISATVDQSRRESELIES